MKERLKFIDFYVKPTLPENLKKLEELSQNLWSTWNPEAYQLFNRIDPKLFRKYNHNPVKLLQQVSKERLAQLSGDKGFLYEMNSVYNKFQNYLKFVGHYSDTKDKRREFANDFQVAYFSMEYGLHESLPIYSGGLGVLSGDHLKAASDLGIPLIAFGLLYRYGYFSQKINLNDMQEEIYEENEWFSKPIKKLQDDNGKDLIFAIKLRDEEIFMQAWKIEVGKIPLYLLDTNIPQNKNKYRNITDYLYVADKEMRILQEIVFAFGSIKLIKILKLNPTVYHLNEGHSAFLIIERLKNLIADSGFNFEQASEIIRKSTVFTTHTPVAAGNEKFDPKLAEFYLTSEIQSFGHSFENFRKLAKVEGDEGFSLPALAIRFSKYVNGVSQLHCKVSKKMWHSIYPQIYREEMPIKAITNGVHLQSWISHRMTSLFDRYMGSDYRHHADAKAIWENIFSIPDNEIWEAHQERKEQMISFIRDRFQESLIHKSGGEGIKRINEILNHNYLTIGFARRFAPYKRATLILEDKERLLKILNNEEQPVQFIFAGKAHPADEKGKEMIKQLIDFARDNKVEDRFVFVENYDMNVARHLVQGVDVWLNNPKKPLEASGTSGMKAGMNGVLNFSVPDGWWPECFNGENGWSIISGENITDDEIRNKLEANEIYEKLENEIIPLFYQQNQNGIPENWVKMMKRAIYDVGKNFNMHRVLKEYLNEFYLPGAQEVTYISKDDFANLKKLEQTKTELAKHWQKIKFLDVSIDSPENMVLQSGEVLNLTVKIDIDGLSEEYVQVEIFYRQNEENFLIVPLEFVHKKNNVVEYKGSLTVSGSGKQSFNVRIKPKNCCYKEFYEYVKWFY